MQPAARIPFPPTVKFRDISDDLLAAINMAPGTQTSEGGDPAPNASEYDSDDGEGDDTESGDEFDECGNIFVAATAAVVEADNDIDLNSPFLLDLLSPTPVVQPVVHVSKCRKQPVIAEGDPNWDW